MLNIAVCDDSQAALQEIQSLLQNDHRVALIQLYSHPEQLCNDISRGQGKYDGVLMDIDFKEKENGFYWAHKLSKIAPNLQIIYVTGYNDQYAQLTLLTDVNLTGYLTKPIQEDILHQYINKISEQCDGKNLLTITVRGAEYAIPTNLILYLESKNHAVILHTDVGIYTTYEKLSNLSERLPSSFIQCHKSFFVNMKRIVQFNIGQIILSDGSFVPVSKSRQVQTRESFLRYLMNLL